MGEVFLSIYIIGFAFSFIPTLIYVLQCVTEADIEQRSIIKLFSRCFIWPIVLLIYFGLGVYYTFQDLFKSH